MTKVTRLTLDNDGALERRRIHLREISGDLDTPLDTVGQDLRAARLRRGDDLATVSRVLKIRKDHLEALEEDRLEALPGRTYAVGFIRSYADYLGLDSIQCVERFKAEIAGRTDPTIQPITVIDEDSERRMPHGWKIMASVIVLLVLYGAYQLAASADKMLNDQTAPPPPTPIHHPVQHKPAPAPVQIAAPQPPTSQPDSSVSTGENAQQQNLQSQTLNSPPPGVQSSGVTAQQPATPLPQGQVYGENNKGVRVVVRLRDTARILVLGKAFGPDGKPTVFMNRTLKRGDTYRVPNIVGLTLTTSNAGAVQVELDGQPVGVLGKPMETGEAISLEPQSIMDRYNGNHGH